MLPATRPTAATYRPPLRTSIPPTPRFSSTPAVHTGSAPDLIRRTYAALALGASALLATSVGAETPSPAPHLRATEPHARSVNVPVPPGTDARPLIVEAVAAPKHISFVGRMSTIRSGQTRALAVLSKVEHRAPDETRRTYLTPRVLYGQFVISRGAMSWDVDPTRKRVVVTENKAAVDPAAVVVRIAVVPKKYRAVRTGSDVIADRKVDVVD